jgi:hypothetical protein
VLYFPRRLAGGMQSVVLCIVCTVPIHNYDNSDNYEHDSSRKHQHDFWRVLLDNV